MSSVAVMLLGDAWGMHGDVGWGWMSVMMVGMVLFWGAVILGIVWLIRGTSGSGSAGGAAPVSRETPVEILERRFAEGAITAEDYRARRQVLLSGSGEPNGAPADEPLTVSGSERASP